jgi:hypothetical protein
MTCKSFVTKKRKLFQESEVEVSIHKKVPLLLLLIFTVIATLI